jgi:hypothetical protein
VVDGVGAAIDGDGAAIDGVAVGPGVAHHVATSASTNTAETRSIQPMSNLPPQPTRNMSR